jgi:hypothetical protein
MAPLLTVTAISPKVLAQRGNQSQLQLDGRRTPGNTQHVPIAPGPPWLEHYAPAFPVRPPPLSSHARDYGLAYSASSYTKCPTTALPTTFLFLTM